jgi:hypothetical protein
MIDPSAINTPAQEISYVIGWVRDLGIFGFVLVVGWNARSIFQEVKDFTKDIRGHMKRMEKFAFRMETNHIRHIELYLCALAKNQGLDLPIETALSDEAQALSDEDNSDARNL